MLDMVLIRDVKLTLASSSKNFSEPIRCIFIWEKASSIPE